MTEKNPPNFPYLPHTDANRKAMLKTIGVDSFEQLVSHIPKDIRAKALDLPSGMSELDLTQYIASLASKNKPASTQACFLGGGSYRRFVPSIVPAITARSEFATAYTPYQAEASQGTLQVIYEFQTAVCLLTGMDIANASIYDGPTACAEAALMACRITGREQLVISQGVNSEYALVTQAYAQAANLQYEYLAIKNGVTDIVSLAAGLKPAAVIVQYPNFFGSIEDLKVIGEATHALGALLIVISDPISLGVLSPPGDFSADIVVGDAQQCGNFLSFGGPSAGYIACRQEFVRQLPGRLAGMTVDAAGDRAYTLTLQTREQHIRRAKATSNICTNQTLNTLAMLVYLTAMGPSGLQTIASLSMQRAHYLAEQLTRLPGVERAFTSPFLNEFAITTSKPSRYVLEELIKKGILGGLNLAQREPAVHNGILIAVTEMNSRAELDNYVASLQTILSKSTDLGSVEKPGSVSLLRFDEASSAVK